jgi:hypothetical protein
LDSPLYVLVGPKEPIVRCCGQLLGCDRECGKEIATFGGPLNFVADKAALEKTTGRMPLGPIYEA